MESSSTALNVFVHMAGGTSTSARRAFSHSLMETLHGLEANAVKPLLCLDEGVAGYAFDLAALHVRPAPPSTPDDRGGGMEIAENSLSLQNSESLAQTPTPNTARTPTSLSSSMIEPLSFLSLAPTLDELLRASLDPLPITKPRLVTDVRSPHEILRLIRDIGVDIFDAGWAVKAADIGVALDFIFPVPSGHDISPDHRKRDIGHNLYDAKYAHDFVSLSDAFLAGHKKHPRPKLPFAHALHALQLPPRLRFTIVKLTLSRTKRIQTTAQAGNNSYLLSHEPTCTTFCIPMRCLRTHSSSHIMSPSLMPCLLECEQFFRAMLIKMKQQPFLPERSKGLKRFMMGLCRCSTLLGTTGRMLSMRGVKEDWRGRHRKTRMFDRYILLK